MLTKLQPIIKTKYRAIFLVLLLFCTNHFRIEQAVRKRQKQESRRRSQEWLLFSASSTMKEIFHGKIVRSQYVIVAVMLKNFLGHGRLELDITEKSPLAYQFWRRWVSRTNLTKAIFCNIVLFVTILLKRLLQKRNAPMTKSPLINLAMYFFSNLAKHRTFWIDEGEKIKEKE